MEIPGSLDLRSQNADKPIPVLLEDDAAFPNTRCMNDSPQPWHRTINLSEKRGNVFSPGNVAQVPGYLNAGFLHFFDLFVRAGGSTTAAHQDEVPSARARHRLRDVYTEVPESSGYQI